MVSYQNKEETYVDRTLLHVFSLEPFGPRRKHGIRARGCSRSRSSTSHGNPGYIFIIFPLPLHSCITARNSIVFMTKARRRSRVRLSIVVVTEADHHSRRHHSRPRLTSGRSRWEPARWSSRWHAHTSRRGKWHTSRW